MSWKVYQQEDNYGCNMLENFQSVSTGRHRTLPCIIKGMVREPEGKFEYDAINDRLPAVSWIIPTSTAIRASRLHAGRRRGVRRQQDRRHRGQPGSLGQNGVHSQLRRKRRHLRPRRRRRSPPPGTPREFVRGLPIGGGFRVPCIIVSPWTAGGWVCSQPFDHTSVLQLLEKFTGVQEPNISDWRRQTFGDLTAAFRFDAEKANPPQLPDTGTALNLATYEAYHLPKPTLPGAKQTPPKQEKGSRKRVPRGE